jgi:hypothetical protein
MSNFKKGSAFGSKNFEDRLGQIEKKFGTRTRKQVEADEGEKDLIETDKDTGPEYVAKQETQKLKDAKELKAEATDYVDMAPGASSYRANLAEWGMWLLMQKEIPTTFEYHCIPTKEGSMNVYGRVFQTHDGILFVLKAPNGKVFAKAMRVCMTPEIDVNAVGLLAVELENTYDSLKGLLLSDQKVQNKIIV